MTFLDKIPMSTAIIMALFLGLAPFVPEPHVWAKIQMLRTGTLTETIDIIDLLFHGAPWLLLFAKIARLSAQKV